MQHLTLLWQCSSTDASHISLSRHLIVVKQMHDIKNMSPALILCWNLFTRFNYWITDFCWTNCSTIRIWRRMLWQQFDWITYDPRKRWRYHKTLEQVADTIAFLCSPSHLLHAGQLLEGGGKPAGICKPRI